LETAEELADSAGGAELSLADGADVARIGSSPGRSVALACRCLPIHVSRGQSHPVRLLFGTPLGTWPKAESVTAKRELNLSGLTRQPGLDKPMK
jgi:hypothetical protein